MPRGRPRKVKIEDTVETTETVETVEKIGEPVKEGKIKEKIKERKIPATEEGKKPAQETEKNIPTKDKNVKDTRPVCQCCGKKIDSSVRTLNLTYLTSIAPYRFEVENENGLVKVCGECALELGKMIETWMIEKGAKKKWSLE